jgi:rod shape-determining protein MreC
VYDRKTVRRRRAVLGLLVACSLILLTAYFGEGTGGGLHVIQRGFAEVLSPVESVGSGALKPFRDFFGWVGDTFDAKKQNGDLKKERDELRAEVIGLQDQAYHGRQLTKLFNLDQNAGLDPAAQVTARVVFHSPTLWYSTVTINKGSGAGVRRDDPVVTSEGLVGRITEVWGNGAKVTLITDRDSGVTARVVTSNVSGTVQTGTPGNPDDLLMTGLERGKPISVGQRLVTAGIQSSNFTSYFPAGIPVGVVTKADPEELQTSQQVHIRPYADLRDLEYVQILTKTAS